MSYSPSAYSGRTLIHVDEEVQVAGHPRWIGKVRFHGDDDLTKVMVFTFKGRYLGIPLLCKHAGAPLTEGLITDNAKLICPRHGHSYDIDGAHSISFDVLRDGETFFLEERQAPLSNDARELKDQIIGLQMELDAQRSANSALEQQVISVSESMDKMFTVMEAKNLEWQDKSNRLENLNDLVNRITDSLSEVMMITGPDGMVYRVNRQAQDILKARHVDFIGRSIDDLLAHEDLVRLRELYADRLREDLPVLYQLCFVESPFEVEVSLRSLTVSSQEEVLPQPFLLRGTRLYDRHGKEEGAIIVASDISRVKEREFRLRQQEIEKTLQLLESTLGNIGHGIAVFDEGGHLLVSNSSFAEITQCPDKWLVPGTSYEIFLALEDENTNLCSLGLEERKFSKSSKKEEHWESYYPDARVIANQIKPMPNGGFVLVSQDVSEQREEAETIRRLSYAVEQSPVEVIITDMEGTIEYVNAKFTKNTGYSKEQALGRKTSMVRSGHTPSQYYENLWETIRSGKQWSGEVLNKRKDGTMFWQMLSVAPMYDPDGTVRNYLATKENIDIRKRAEEELARHRDHLQELVEDRTSELISARDEAERANKAKTDFLSSMSHELRTPLNGILGFSQLLEMDRKEQLSETQLDYVQHIMKAGHHLLGLISEILDLAKIEAGKISLDLKQVDIGNIFLECNALVSSLASERDVSINDMFTSKEWTVYGDTTRIKQVIVNVLSNAIKYNRDGGEVSITAEVNDTSMFVLSITDTGYGIAEDKMIDLFTPFNRLGAEGQNIEGSGIGLTITRKLIRMMGGNIQAKSEENVGSTFTLLLPTSDREIDKVDNNILGDAVVFDLTDETSSSGEFSYKTDVNDGKAFNGKTVLYIEDNRSNQFLVERAISNIEGLKLYCALDAVSGIEFAKRDLPDVILMDINLPGMSGFDALIELQKDDDTTRIPVIALSAKALSSDIEAGLNAGFRAYLTKPINIPDLLSTIERILEEHVI